MSFLASAMRKTTDIREFLREAANNNSLRYRAEQGRKHYIHIPFVQVQTTGEDGSVQVTNQIIALYANVHEWETADGKYKASVCLKDVIRKDDSGNLLNDGSCPICDRVKDAWDIYKYRCELEEQTCGLTGDALKQHMEGIKGANGMVEKPGFKKQAADERKAKEAVPYLYLLIVQYRTDSKKNDDPIIGQNGLPEYDLKVMKLSRSRVEKIKQQVENSGLKFEGCDLVIEYPKDAENAALVVSQSTTAPVFPGSSITGKFPGLAKAIQNDIAKFTWEGIEKAFHEWQGMTVAEAKSTMDALFAKWDEYKRELAVNPNAKYLEYVGAVASQAIGATPVGAALPGAAPIIPGVSPIIPGEAPGVAPAVPGAAPVTPGAQAAPVNPAPQAPVNPVQPAAPANPVQQAGAPVAGAPQGVPTGIPDVNAVFGSPDNKINI